MIRLRNNTIRITIQVSRYTFHEIISQTKDAFLQHAFDFNPVKPPIIMKSKVYYSVVYAAKILI